MRISVINLILLNENVSNNCNTFIYIMVFCKKKKEFIPFIAIKIRI